MGWRCEKFVEMGISRNVRHVVGLEMWAEKDCENRVQMHLALIW